MQSQRVYTWASKLIMCNCPKSFFFSLCSSLSIKEPPCSSQSANIISVHCTEGQREFLVPGRSYYSSNYSDVLIILYKERIVQLGPAVKAKTSGRATFCNLCNAVQSKLRKSRDALWDKPLLLTIIHGIHFRQSQAKDFRAATTSFFSGLLPNECATISPRPDNIREWVAGQTG